MRFLVKSMNERKAKEILMWKYEYPYDFYNNELSEEGIREFMEGNYFSVVDETNQLVGFFCTGISAQVPNGIPFGAYQKECIDIGLGMKPSLTGKGLGSNFFTFILQQIDKKDRNPLQLRLTVATFNKRAIKLYEKVGFIKKQTFMSNNTEFQTMVLHS